MNTFTSNRRERRARRRWVKLGGVSNCGRYFSLLNSRMSRSYQRICNGAWKKTA